MKVSPAKRRKQAGTSSGSGGSVARRIATAGGAPAPDDADEAPPLVGLKRQAAAVISMGRSVALSLSFDAATSSSVD